MHAIASNGMRAAVEEMLPKMEKAAGGPIEFQYGTTTDLVRPRKMQAAASFEVMPDTAVFSTRRLDTLAKLKPFKGGGRVEPTVKPGVRRASPL